MYDGRPRPGHIRIASYNIAHGRGTVASNWDGGSHAERMARMAQMASLLRKIDADVVVLNEVDFDASWSHSTNQARFLADNANYPYRVEQRNLDFRILGWTWRFGNAVLSKYPISNAKAVSFPSYSWWETVLAGKKRGVVCDIETPERSVRVIGAHLSHRSELVRVRSAARLADVATASVLPTIVVGDLNSTPSGFPNSVSDFAGDNAIDVLDKSQYFRRSPEHPPIAASDFTFSSVEPRAIIDWILIPREWNFEEYTVEPSELSDHRPVYADVAPQ